MHKARKHYNSVFPQNRLFILESNIFKSLTLFYTKWFPVLYAGVLLTAFEQDKLCSILKHFKEEIKR